VIELSGEWKERSQPWHNVRVANCQVCGRLLRARSWSFSDSDFGAIDACGPACEHLWHRYLRGRRLELAGPLIVPAARLTS
jgi:hypothetical protein